MNKARWLLFFALAVALVAGVSCYLGSCFMHAFCSRKGDAHEWIHQQLNISAEEEKGLESYEKSFAEKKKHYEEVIRLTNMELAQAILESQGDSPQVTAALEKILKNQGELQKATLEHVFEMKTALSPEKYQKLLDLTANALYQSQF